MGIWALTMEDVGKRAQNRLLSLQVSQVQCSWLSESFKESLELGQISVSENLYLSQGSFTSSGRWFQAAMSLSVSWVSSGQVIRSRGCGSHHLPLPVKPAQPRVASGLCVCSLSLPSRQLCASDSAGGTLALRVPLISASFTCQGEEQAGMDSLIGS